MRSPSCGGHLAGRAAVLTLTVVCPKCHSILDARDANFQVLEKFWVKQEIQPKIPLGSRGKINGDDYEMIGFEVRTTDDDDVPDIWDEYMLFNRYTVFRSLYEYR